MLFLLFSLESFAFRTGGDQRERDIPIIDEKASFKTPYHLLRVEVKEDIFMEIPRAKIPNFPLLFQRVLLPY